MNYPHVHGIIGRKKFSRLAEVYRDLQVDDFIIYNLDGPRGLSFGSFSEFKDWLTEEGMKIMEVI